MNADFRKIVGRKEIFKKVQQDSTLGQILDSLAEEYNGEFRDIVDPETGMISLDFLISVNGLSARNTNVKLNDNDVVMVTIPAGGG